MSYIKKTSFRRVTYKRSLFKWFSNLGIRKKLAKETTVLNFNVYLTHVKAQEKHKNKQQMIENSIEISQYLIAFSLS